MCEKEEVKGKKKQDAIIERILQENIKKFR